MHSATYDDIGIMEEEKKLHKNVINKLFIFAASMRARINMSVAATNDVAIVTTTV